MLEQVLPLARGRAEIEVRDVDEDPEWRRKYDIRVPVIEVDGKVVSDYPLEVEALNRCLDKMPENNPEIGILRR